MIYLELLFAFLKVGLFSFGGAYGAIPLIRDVVLAHGWMSEAYLTYMIAVSESTPGPIMVNMATYVGSTQAGFFGAVVATVGVVLPSFCVILLVTAILKNLTDNKYFKAVLQGLKPCIIGIILATGLHLIVTNCITMKENIGVDVKAVYIMLILLGVMFGYQKITRKKLSSIMLIVVSAIVGIGVGAIGI
ncbi:MAG: chromate transporter [Agathobacter sp.]|nr:chromate transporter [Agathobacter sp.]